MIKASAEFDWLRSMMNYEQLIDGYESFTSEEEDDLLIDECCGKPPLPPPVKQYSMPAIIARDPPQRPPRLKMEEYRPHYASQLSFDKNYRRDRLNDRNSMGKKQYTFLSSAEMQAFERDIIRGDLSKDELCNKYNVSISTAARFIRNYKAFGKISVKKSEVSTNDLINRVIAQNPNVRYEQITQAIQKLQGRPRDAVNGLAGTRFSKK